MIDFLRNQLGDQFKVIKYQRNEEKAIEVYRNMNKEVDLDTFIRLIQDTSNNLWILSVVQRDEENCIGQFNNPYTGFCALFIASVSRLSYEGPSDDVITEIRSVGDNRFEAQEILRKYVSEEYFSLFDESPGAINLEVHDDKYNAYYLSLTGEKVSIVKGRKAPGIFVVIYNYAKSLEQFDIVMQTWEENSDIPLDEWEKLKIIFLGKS